MLKTGDVAPEFSLLSDKGDTVTLAGFRGSKNVVLIFYPGDATPGCTKQLCAIRDDYAAFEKKNAVVFGVNPGSMESHRKFAERKKYQFPLLVDQDKAVAERYGVKGIFVVRTVFVIGKDGKVVYVKKGMPSNEEILSAIPE